MVLEAVMVVVDNSEHSRNGDYQPTRFDAQSDAVSTLFQTITNGNPESSVGLMSMGGKGPEVLTTLTTEHGKILDGLHRTKKKLGGSSQLKTGIQVATLALKHRQNRAQRQRIIVFICSPVADDKKELVTLAKKMKKGNITVDFVLFGDIDDDDSQEKLDAFNEAVKGNEGSHLVVFPPSSKLLGDQLVSSPILLGDNAGGSGDTGGVGGGEEFEFGIDPALEPELALALRMSMEEEKARQEKKAKEEEEAAKKASLGNVKEEDESGGGASGSGDKKDGGDKMDTS